MPYIDAVIKECLRLHDPATLVFRRALQDIAVGDGLVIPKVGCPKVDGDPVTLKVCVGQSGRCRLSRLTPGRLFIV